MKVDVFIRTMAKENDLRRYFREATRTRWMMEDVNLVWIWDEEIRTARLWAEEHARSEFYIFTDDDLLPWGKDWLRRGLAAMADHPFFALASSRSVITEEAGNYSIPVGVGILPVPAVGAPMWIRKGVIGTDLPEFPFVSECTMLYDYTRKKGFQSGIINGLFHLHWGWLCYRPETGKGILMICWAIVGNFKIWWSECKDRARYAKGGDLFQ